MNSHLALRNGWFGSLLVSLFLTSALGADPVVPSGFVVENALFNNALFNNPTSIATFPDGRWLVGEKRGVAWTVTNGVKAAKPLWSAPEEVLNSGDRGLISVAVDPAYRINHRVYFLYAVDPDSDGVDAADPAFTRLVRYETSAADSNVVDTTTRTILIGKTWREGITSASLSHSADCLGWGEDGSLLVSHGDGAHYEYVDAGGHDPLQFIPGRSDSTEDIGSFRSQDPNSLAGKVLRINPENGFGYASNPYAGSDLAAPAAKIWAMGFRNPFRFCVRPGTGSADTALGRPGTILLGDVGLNTWEELNVIDRPGMNFGWPCREGRGPQPLYLATHPTHHGCDTMTGATSDPTVMWHHTDSTLSAPYGLLGNCTAGGLFYTANRYPAYFRGRLFFGDFGQGWLKVATLDSAMNVVQLQDFATELEGPVDWAIDPVSGDLLYVSIYNGQVRRIRYTGAGTGEAPPIARASASTTIGEAPTAITFSSLGSYDPSGDPITFTWSFGDLTPPSIDNHPVHVFQASGEYLAILTVMNSRGAAARDTVKIVIARNSAGFPVTAVLDTLNGADRPLVAPWVGSLSGLAIRNGALTQNVSPSYATWNGAVFGANQEVFVSFDSVNAAAPEHTVLLKVQGTSWAAGTIQVMYAASQSVVVVSTYTPNVGWIRRGGPWPVPFGRGDQLGARAFSNGMVVVTKNGQTIGTASMQDWPFAESGGRIGLKLVGALGSRMVRFGGGDVRVDLHTPPHAHILSPVDRSFFVAGNHVVLSGTADDDEEPASTLTLGWAVDLIHNNHVHPSIHTFTAAVDSFEVDDHDDGTGVYYRAHLFATDPVGLTDTATVSLYPEIDLAPSTVITDPLYPTAVGTTTYSFTLANRGRMPAHISRWALVANGVTLAQGDTVIRARDSVLIVRTLPNLAPGTYTLRAVADTLRGVTEPNEANNATVRPFTVVSFPSTAVIDGFARPDGPLATPWVGSLSGFLVSNRALVHTGTSNYAVWNGAVYGADQEAFVRFDSLTTSSPEHDLLLKVQGTTWTNGALQIVHSPTAGTVVVNTYTPVGGWLRRAGPWKAVFAHGDQLGARATADGWVRVFKNGVKIGEVNVASWTYASKPGRIGLLLSNAKSSRVAEFGGGGLTPPRGTVVSPVSGSHFTANQAIVLSGDARDDQDPAAALSLRWLVDRVRDGGVDAGFFTSTARLDSFRTEAAGVLSYRIRLVTTDPAGLCDTACVSIFPETDLAPSAVLTAPLRPTGVGVTTYAFILANRGRMATPFSRWALLANGVILAQGDTAVGALDSVRIARTLPSLTPGTYTLRAVADTLRAVVETDEANNASAVSLVVGEFPGTPVIDAFARADGPLASPWVGSLAGLAISNQALVQSGATNYAIWNGAAYGADQEAFVRLDSLTASSPEHDLLLKVQGATWTNGAIQITFSPLAATVVVNTYTPGSGWLRRAGPWKATFVAGDQLGARATADGMVRVFRNGVKIGEVNVASWAFANRGGRVGLILNRANASRLTLFGGGDVRPDSGQAVATGIAIASRDSLARVQMESAGRSGAVLLPRIVALSPAFPNPSRGEVALALELPEPARVSLEVFDLQGRVMWRAPDHSWDAGRWRLQWPGHDRAGRPAGSGVYLVRTTIDGKPYVRRVMIAR